MESSLAVGLALPVAAAGAAVVGAWSVLRRRVTAARIAGEAVRRALAADGGLAPLAAAHERALRDGVAGALGLPPSEELAADLLLHADDVIDAVGEVQARVAADPGLLVRALADLGHTLADCLGRGGAAGAATGLLAGAAVVAAGSDPVVVVAAGLCAGAVAAEVGARVAVAALSGALRGEAARRLAALLLPPDVLLRELLTGPRAARLAALARRHVTLVAASAAAAGTAATADDAPPRHRPGADARPPTATAVVSFHVEPPVGSGAVHVRGEDARTVATMRLRAGSTRLTAAVGALLGGLLALAGLWAW